MGLAFTEDEIRYAILDARPEADFLTDVNTMVTECGWTRLGDFNNGSEYLLESPQGLKARCRLWSHAAGPGDWPRRFILQMGSDATPGMVGLEHAFAAGSATTDSGLPPYGFSQYSVWCNKCSIFIGAVATDTRTNYPKAVQAGIPFASGLVGCPGETPAPPDLTVELWFSAGDDSGTPAVFGIGTVWCLRNQHVSMRYSFCHNGTLWNVNMDHSTPEQTMSLATEPYMLQAGILRSARFWTRGTEKFDIGFVYPDGSPIAHNPLLYHNARIYGELYDAVLLSKPMAVETVEQIFDSATGTVTEWQNYMNATGPNNANLYSASATSNEASAAAILLLRVGPSVFSMPVVNVAY